MLAQEQDRLDELLRAVEDGIALARRRGDRSWEWILTSVMVEYQSMTGAWDDALATAAEMPQEARTFGYSYYPAEFITRVHVERGELAEARAVYAGIADRENSPDLQARGFALLARASLHRAEGTLSEARATPKRPTRFSRHTLRSTAPRRAPRLCEASFRLGELDPVQQLLGDGPPSRRHGVRCRSRDRRRGSEGVSPASREIPSWSSGSTCWP